LLPSHTDPDPPCELHTHNLWQSHADANGDADGHSDGNSYRYSDGNCDGYSNCHRYGYGYSDSNGYSDRTAAAYTDATASADTASSPVGILSRGWLTLMWELARVPRQILQTSFQRWHISRSHKWMEPILFARSWVPKDFSYIQTNIVDTSSAA
jgi:hypothetical protein